VKVEGANVQLTFNPTTGRFTFNSKSILGDPKDKAPPTIMPSLGGDTYWSNAVQAMAGQLAKKALRRGWLLKTLIGSAIGAGFGFMSSILVVDQTQDGLYVPQTTIGVVFAHLIELVPFALIGAAMGFFSSLAMSKTSKMLIGAAVGAGFALASVLFLATIGMQWSLETFFGYSLFWGLIWVAIGFFSGQRRTPIPKTFIPGAIGASIGFIPGLLIGLTYPESLGPTYSQIITRYSASLRPKNEKSGTSFTQADVYKAKKTGTIFQDEYWKCLAAEALRMVSTNISAQEFSLLIKGACLAERNKYAVQLIDVISMTSANPNDIAAVITSTDSLIDQIQTAAVYQFTKLRSGQ
jgi:hypothetical protein